MQPGIQLTSKGSIIRYTVRYAVVPAVTRSQSYMSLNPYLRYVHVHAHMLVTRQFAILRWRFALPSPLYYNRLRAVRYTLVNFAILQDDSRSNPDR
jgi:hypothetical protein